MQTCTTSEQNAECKAEQSRQAAPGCSSSFAKQTKIQKKQDRPDARRTKKFKSKHVSSSGSLRWSKSAKSADIGYSNFIQIDLTDDTELGNCSTTSCRSKDGIAECVRPHNEVPTVQANTSSDVHNNQSVNVELLGDNAVSAWHAEEHNGETDSDDEAIRNFPYNAIASQPNNAQESYGAVSEACAKAEKMSNKGALVGTFGPGADIKHTVDVIMQRSYGIPVRPDQKGSIFSILGQNGYFEEKQLQDILITLMINDNCTYWYHHGQADDYCDHKFPHLHILHYTSGNWTDSALAKRVSRFKSHMRLKEIIVQYDTLAIKSPAGFMRYMLVGNKTLHILNENSKMSDTQILHYQQCMEYYRDIEERPDNVKFQLLKNKFMEKILKQTGVKGKSCNLQALEWLLTSIRATNAHGQQSLRFLPLHPGM